MSFKAGDLCYRSQKVKDAPRVVLTSESFDYHDDYRACRDVNVPAWTPILIVKTVFMGETLHIALHEDKFILVHAMDLRRVGS